MSSHLDYEINKELGECYLFMGELEKAESYYNKATVSNPLVSAPYIGLATIAIQRNDLDTALSLYEKAAEVDPNDKSYAGIGLVYMEQSKDNEAMDMFRKSLTYNVANAVSLSCLVRLAYTHNALESILPLLEDAMAVEEKQHSRITLAGCLISLDRHEEAIPLLETALEKEPDNLDAQELLDHIKA